MMAVCGFVIKVGASGMPIFQVLTFCKRKCFTLLWFSGKLFLKITERSERK